MSPIKVSSACLTKNLDNIYQILDKVDIFVKSADVTTLRCSLKADMRIPAEVRDAVRYLRCMALPIPDWKGHCKKSRACIKAARIRTAKATETLRNASKDKGRLGIVERDKYRESREKEERVLSREGFFQETLFAIVESHKRFFLHCMNRVEMFWQECDTISATVIRPNPK